MDNLCSKSCQSRTKYFVEPWAEGAAEVGHQGGEGENQGLCDHQRVVGHRLEGEEVGALLLPAGHQGATDQPGEGPLGDGAGAERGYGWVYAIAGDVALCTANPASPSTCTDDTSTAAGSPSSPRCWPSPGS